MARAVQKKVQELGAEGAISWSNPQHAVVVGDVEPHVAIAQHIAAGPVRDHGHRAAAATDPRKQGAPGEYGP